MILNYDQSFVAEDSTSIDTVYYDSKEKILGVVFENGNSAGYMGVSFSTFEAFKASASAGRYYNSFIRGSYRGVRIDGLVKAEGTVQATLNTTAKFKVVAEITGDVTLDVQANDLTDALKVAEEQINKAFGGSVKISFKGVNVV